MTVSAPWAAETTTGLASYLSGLWETQVQVTLDDVASTGARRRNVLFSATTTTSTATGPTPGDVLRLVATIVPNPNLQIQEFMLEPDMIRVAEAGGVPVAHVIGATTDESFVGGPFFISHRIDGETVPRRVLRLSDSAGLGGLMARQAGAAFAALHAIDIAAAPDTLTVADGDPCAAALDRLAEAMVVLLQPSAAFALAARWLELHRPSGPVPVTIVHTDIRVGNVIVADDGLRAVLDWEGVRTGDPMEDLAWMAVRMWRFGNDDREVGGFCDVATLAEAYTAAGGTWDEPRFRWWQILGTLRWGVGLAVQAIAHLDGSVPSVVMAASGRRIAEQEYDTLTLIRRQMGPQ